MTMVATLLATLTFAAAFTMPGGFDSRPDNLGVAILVKKASLKVFILADSIAMCCSMAVMFLLLWVMIAEKENVINLAYISSQVLQFAFLATLVAFASGIFAVMPPKALWVPTLVGIFCWIVAFISGPGNLLLSRIYFWLREVPGVFLQILCGSRYKKGRKQVDGE
ncbi:hypothetical protein Vadar_010356 [Vaccinium darrowii]|uniref:Uncharacterized protein n=1 Tax=Vaccinium darrowii TaxID=229202 RepID=A0ACB7ZIS1_9ERIC|nr:hypothetical protein Vadar_010356 [Vaccinium darrowii]